LLLVDGDTRSLRVLEVSLKKAGFTVTTASDGRQALDIVEASPPELIISNTELEALDGFEFCEALKKNESTAAIPFIFLTEQKAIEHKIRGLELGVDEYLIKPIYIKEILTRVRIMLQKRDRVSLEGRKEHNTRFSGKLTDMGVVDLIQTIEVSSKSGVSHFTAPTGQRASLYFRDGRIIDAELGALSGADAVYRLLTWADGDFEVLFRAVRRRDVIELSSQALLMEGMRRLDEWGRLLEQLPPLDSRFEVFYAELAERLAELPDELNLLLRLFDGRRTLMDIIDQTRHGDLESLELIAKLFFEGLIVESRLDVSSERESWPPPVARPELGEAPASRIRRAGAHELEHDPGDEVLEDIVLGEESGDEITGALEPSGGADGGPRRRRGLSSLLEAAIGAVSPAFPDLGRLPSPAAGSSPGREPPRATANGAAAVAHAGEADGPGQAASASAEDSDKRDDTAGIREATGTGEIESQELGRVVPERRVVPMIPKLVERVRNVRREDDDAGVRLTAAGEIEAAGIATEVPAERTRPVLRIVPDREAADDETGDDFIELQEQDDETPTPTLSGPDYIPPAFRHSRPQASPHIISSAGQEFAAVAGAIAGRAPAHSSSSGGGSSVVIADADLRRGPDLEEATLEERLGARARRTSPLAFTGTSVRDGARRSSLPLFVGVAAAATLIGLIMVLRSGSTEAPEVSSSSPPPSPAAEQGAAAPAPSPTNVSSSALAVDAGTAPTPDATTRAPEETALSQPGAGAGVPDSTTPPRNRAAERKARVKELLADAERARRRGDTHGALQLVQEAIEIRRTGSMLALKARLMLELKNRGGAIRAADETLSMSPQKAGAWFTKGTAHWQLGQRDQARTAFARFLELQPAGARADQVRALLANP
jgi:CheY-like chemotaxis protein